MAKNTKTEEPAGVIGKHRHRMENDPDYREAALTAPAPIRGKYLTNTAPTKPQAQGADNAADDEASALATEPPVAADPVVASESQRERPSD